MLKNIDWSSRGRARIHLITVVGTLACAMIALAFDSFNFETGEWQLTSKWFNNLIIPVLLAPPLFYYLLGKLRELALAHDELVNIASTDSLTSCLNRRAFTAVVEGYLDRVANEEIRGDGALLVIDIDNFKNVNDRFGHDLGDEALQLIAGAIRDTVRDIDLVGRLGGEEFGVFLPGLSPEGSAGVAERIRQAINDAAFSPQGRRHPLSASIGGATFNRETSFTQLYRTADQHLYAAKRDGRNRVDIDAMPPPGVEQPVTLH
jgi:diguanylate cyclase (GGDEF)-like protein